MINEIYLKKTSYEILIRRSLTRPESTMHFKAINAYFHFCTLSKLGKETASRKQYLVLKAYLIRALQKFIKRIRSREKKSELSILINSLESAVTLSQIDLIIEESLNVTRSLI